MSDAQTAATRAAIERLYAAYLAGDLDGMLAEMSDDVLVTFLGHGTFRGKSAVRPYMTWGGAQLPRLDFHIRRTIVEGDGAAVVWDETGTTARGEPWASQGVDVYRVAGGKIIAMTVYSDTEKLLRQIGPYPGSA